MSEPSTSFRVPPNWGTALTEADYASLERSWIDRKCADAAMLRRVDAAEGRDIVGQKGSRDCSGILIPSYWPGEPRPFNYRIRRDNPEFTADHHGGLKPEAKYLGAPGCTNRLYVPPGVTVEQLEDVTTPVVTLEGEKKALAVWRLSNLGAAEPRWIAVAIAGVWCWRGKTGKDYGPNGDRNDTKGPISDLNRIAWNGRQVLIVFDTNVHTNTGVRAARFALARELAGRGARVGFVNLPEDSRVNGIDDLLASWGPDRVLTLFEHPESAGVRDQPSQAQVLVKLAQQARFFHTPDDQAFAQLPGSAHREIAILRSKNFRDWLMLEYAREFDKPAGARAIEDTIALLEAKALRESEEEQLYVRVGERNNNVYLDLCNRRREIVEITSEGWRVVTESPVFFRRSKAAQPLPRPADGGSLTLLRELINIGDDDNWVLCAAWLVAACRPKGPYPVLILQGEQGSAKSTMAKLLRRLVDPSAALVRSLPMDERNLLVTAINSWIIAIDNVSDIPPWLSDAFCRLATGGGFAARRLYTDAEEVILYAQRPIILNGIVHLAERADLADRALILNLPSIDERARRDEARLYANFERDFPVILGALCTAVSTALKRLPEVQLERMPRMADFALWATAAEPAFGFEPGRFMQSYLGNRAHSMHESIEGDQVGSAVLALMNHLAQMRKDWVGTCQDLLRELTKYVDDSTKKSPAWPKNARCLSSRLRRLSPALRESGINLSFRKGAKGMRPLTLARITPNPTATTATEQPNRLDDPTALRVRPGGGRSEEEAETSSRHVVPPPAAGTPTILDPLGKRMRVAMEAVNPHIPERRSPATASQLPDVCSRCGCANWKRGGGGWVCRRCGLPETAPKASGDVERFEL